MNSKTATSIYMLCLAILIALLVACGGSGGGEEGPGGEIQTLEEEAENETFIKPSNQLEGEAPNGAGEEDAENELIEKEDCNPTAMDEAEFEAGGFMPDGEGECG